MIQEIVSLFFSSNIGLPLGCCFFFKLVCSKGKSEKIIVHVYFVVRFFKKG